MTAIDPEEETVADEGLAPALVEALGVRKLSPFEGQDVIRCAIEVPGAAGGLREALKFDPIEMHIGEEAVLVMKVRCKKVRHDEIKDTDALSRVHVLEPLEDLTAFVDEALVKDALQEQVERVRLAKEKAAGVQRLVDTRPDGSAAEPDELEEAEALVVHHNSGLHADERRDACPLCREEIDAEEREAAEDAAGATPIGKGRRGRGKAGDGK